jgi:hypothetical protein
MSNFKLIYTSAARVREGPAKQGPLEFCWNPALLPVFDNVECSGTVQYQCLCLANLNPAVT